MMKSVFNVFLFIVFLGSSAFAASPYSAQRRPNESWKTAYKKFQLHEALKYKIFQTKKSANDSAVAYDKVDINQIPEFNKSDDETQKLFQDIRDIRFLKDPSVANFDRRISWLYPMDGCFARAEWVSHLLKKQDPKAQFSRVFIFGDLKVKTKNSSSGSVTWWYHVAVVVRLQGKAFVIDPSLEVKHPIELSEWVKLQVPNPSKDAQLAICSDSAYHPGSDCAAKQMFTDAEAADEISDYLSYERSNLKSLGRDPDAELGNNPPWL